VSGASCPGAHDYADGALESLGPVLTADDGGTARCRDADPGGNGVPNLLAYAMGLDAQSTRACRQPTLLRRPRIPW